MSTEFSAEKRAVIKKNTTVVRDVYTENQALGLDTSEIDPITYKTQLERYRNLQNDYICFKNNGATPEQLSHKEREMSRDWDSIESNRAKASKELDRLIRRTEEKNLTKNLDDLTRIKQDICALENEVLLTSQEIFPND